MAILNCAGSIEIQETGRGGKLFCEEYCNQDTQISLKGDTFIFEIAAILLAPWCVTLSSSYMRMADQDGLREPNV